MKRRLTSLLLALAMLLTLLPVQAFAAEAARPVDTIEPCEDVEQGSWYYDAVQYVRTNGLIKGITNTTFWPEGTMTRGMFVTVLGRMAGVNQDNYAGPSQFSDVSEDAYYAPYVAWAAKYGVTIGMGNGIFSPDAYITRQQMAVFFVRYFETFDVDYETNVTITSTPADLDSVASWAQDAVLKLWRTGLLVGDNGLFDPTGNATRAQAATICSRTDGTVSVWYSEPGTASTRVRIDPATGLPYDNGSQPDKPSGGSSGSSDGGNPGGSSGSSDGGNPGSSSGSSDGGNSGGSSGSSDGGSSGGSSGSSDGGNSGGGTAPAPGDSWSVSFYDGSRMIKNFSVKKGEPLGQLPTVAESSKANYILEGYYTDSGFTTPFYAEKPVTGNMSVYAKYESMGEPEALTLDSFARMDQQPNVSFRFKALEGADTLEAAKAAVTLLVKDGSDPVEITVSGSGGVYTVSAPAGFNPGCSYELKLAEGWTFLPDGSDTIDSEAIRTAAFSIAMAEVEDLSMNSGIRYVQDTDSISYTYTNAGGESNAVDYLPSDADISGGGSFNYSGDTNGWDKGDILCIYVGAQPDDGDESTKTEEAIYAKVSSISGNTVNFEPLGADDQMKLYEIPDNFPIQVDALPTGTTGTVSINNLDAALYAQMVGTAEGTLGNAKGKLSEGDFVSLYVDSASITSESDVYFGRIDRINESDGTLYFTKCTAADIEDSANLYKSVDVENTDMVTPAEATQIETIVQAQVERSGFAEEAAYYLADMATQTEGFRRSMGVMDFAATGADGESISQAELVSYAGIMELADDSDKPEVKVSVVLDPSKLHFGDKGVQLAVEVSAEFEVDAQDEGKIHFDLSATFVQEVAVDPKVRGELVTKKILFIPVPTGVQVNAIVDVKSYTAMSLRADIYTEGPEDEDTWTKFKAFTKDPTALADISGLPAGLTDGIKTVGEAIDKIEETKAKIDKGLEDTNKLKSDLEALWSVVEASAQNGLTRETYENACETLGKTNVAGELMDMLHLSQDEISADYYHGLDELMDKYSEMLERETDWVQLVNEEMFDSHTPPEYGIMVGVQGSFVVRADVNITLGSNLEYEVGKRYNFWFRVGLFKPTSGSSTMDLIDEHFAFQFYVMGKLGLKTGVRLKIYAAIGSKDAISVGLTTELGPYVKLWGFFLYDYSRHRPANTQKWVYKEQMAGALYLEFGLYLTVGMEAKALFLEYDHDFVDEEFPLLDAGDRDYYYGAAYEPLDDSDEIVVYNNGSATLQSGCAVSMVLPADTYALKVIDLTTGKQSTRSLGFDNYTFKLSNPNFRVDNVNGKPVISVVSIPENVRLMQCDLTITYKHGKLAFSTFDMSTTVHLAWTNMTASEYQQVYTASVTVPDGNGGREVIWSQRVRKGTPFDLPTEEEVKSLLSWSDAKYTAGSGYGSQPTEGVTLIENTQYYYDLGYQTYQLTVTGIEGGGTQTFTGKYGEPFDFSALANTGMDGPDKYTRFAGLMMDGQTLALNQPIDGQFTADRSATAVAQYADETAIATFAFTVPDGFEAPAEINVVLRKGGIPDTEAVLDAVPTGLGITGFYPEVGPVDGDTTYQVVCEIPAGNAVTVTFQPNNGEEAASATKAVGAVLGVLPSPTRTGYAFGGWFTDDETFQNKVDANTVVTEAMTLYAKWVVGTYTVTFNTNGGVNLEPSTMPITYGQPYGELPTPEYSGYGFRGWWTEQDGGTEITADTTVDTTESHILYAHWVELKVIPSSVFDFGSAETVTYNKTAQPASYAFTPEDGETYNEDSFTIRYTRVSDEFIGENKDVGTEPTMAGTYNVTITRDDDDTYAKFDQTYDGVLTINRATSRDLSSLTNDSIYSWNNATYSADVGMTQAKLRIRNVDDLDTSSSQLYFEYTVKVGSTSYVYKNHEVASGLIYDLAPGTTFTVTAVKITGDVNYEDAEKTGLTKEFTTNAAPTNTVEEQFGDMETYCASSYFKDWAGSEIVLSGPGDLAALAYMVNTKGKTFEGQTIKLGENIDCSSFVWTPIGTLTSNFKGTFDGCGHKITGLYYTGNAAYGGLFSIVDGAVIRNLTLDDCYFTKLLVLSANIRGGMIGAAASATTVENCISNATIEDISDQDRRISDSESLTKTGCTVRPLPTKV